MRTPGFMVRQILSSLDDEAAGPSYSVPALSFALQRREWDSIVLAVGTRKSGPGIVVHPQDFRDAPILSRLRVSTKLSEAIHVDALSGATLHMHGLWQMPNLYPARAARKYGVPLILSPRGMLGAEALAFSRTRKRAFWALAQERAVKQVNCFHATCEAEAEDIRRAGLSAPIAIIPNGIDIQPTLAKLAGKSVLYLGRVHPKKGIDRLIRAWGMIADRYPAWTLRIVGPSEIGCRDELESLVHTLRTPRVIFEGPLFGSDKYDAYSAAGVVVLPTLNENFGMVVAEALATGVPVISTKGAPWSGLETNRCGWWVDHGPDALAKALTSCISLSDEERQAMGTRGRTWMLKEFGWDTIAANMARVYEWCSGRGDRPEYVML